MFKNSVLRISGPKRKEVAEGWIIRHKEELHNLNSSQNIFRVIKSKRIGWVEHVACMVTIKNSYKILVGKSEVKRLPGRPRRDGSLTLQ